MQATILKKVTVFIRQNIEYATEQEKREKIAEIESHACADLDNMQYGGDSEYEYRYDGIDEAGENFPYWIFVN